MNTHIESNVGIKCTGRRGRGIAPGQRLGPFSIRPSPFGVRSRLVALGGAPCLGLFLDAGYSSHVGACLQAPLDHERPACEGRPSPHQRTISRMGGEGNPGRCVWDCADACVPSRGGKRCQRRAKGGRRSMSNDAEGYVLARGTGGPEGEGGGIMWRRRKGRRKRRGGRT